MDDERTQVPETEASIGAPFGAGAGDKGAGVLRRDRGESLVSVQDRPGEPFSEGELALHATCGLEVKVLRVEGDKVHWRFTGEKPEWASGKIHAYTTRSWWLRKKPE